MYMYCIYIILTKIFAKKFYPRKNVFSSTIEYNFIVNFKTVQISRYKNIIKKKKVKVKVENTTSP